MSFEYKGFKIERLDDSNVTLLRWGPVNKVDKVTKAVTTVEEWVRLGYYATFFGAARRLIDRLAEEAKDPKELEQIIKEWAFIHKELDK